MEDLNETKPIIDDEKLLDDTNCSIDSIEKRLQESLLGISPEKISEAGSEQEVGIFEKNRLF